MIIIIEIDHCRSCGAEIIWTETNTGKRMPVDADVTANGNIMLGLRANMPPLARVIPKQLVELLHAELTYLYESHFIRCPAKQWRARP